MSLLEIRRDAGAVSVAFARPDQRNALSLALIGELRGVLGSLAADPETRVVILSGKGPSFCGGADLAWIQALVDGDAALWSKATDDLTGLLSDLATFEKPLVARLHGNVVGAGAAIAATCDVVLAAEDTRFTLPELRLGMVPTVVTPFLIARLGAARAKAILMTGEPLSARQALEIGLVTSLAPQEQLDAAVAATVRNLLAAAPEATIAFKRMLRELTLATWPGQIGIVSEEAARALQSDEGRVGVRAFLAKAKPPWAAG